MVVLAVAGVVKHDADAPGAVRDELGASYGMFFVFVQAAKRAAVVAATFDSVQTVNPQVHQTLSIQGHHPATQATSR